MTLRDDPVKSLPVNIQQMRYVVVRWICSVVYTLIVMDIVS